MQSDISLSLCLCLCSFTGSETQNVSSNTNFPIQKISHPTFSKYSNLQQSFFYTDTVRATPLGTKLVWAKLSCVFISPIWFYWKLLESRELTWYSVSALQPCLLAQSSAEACSPSLPGDWVDERRSVRARWKNGEANDLIIPKLDKRLLKEANVLHASFHISQHLLGCPPPQILPSSILSAFLLQIIWMPPRWRKYSTWGNDNPRTSVIERIIEDPLVYIHHFVHWEP